MDFFDFQWGKDAHAKAVAAQESFKEPDRPTHATITGLLIAAVVTSRGRRRSPSSVLELLLKMKRRTNPNIVAHINDAWNVAVDQMYESGDRVDVLTSLITPKHNNSKHGTSEVLEYQLTQTYESLVDYWTVLADFMTGFRTVAVKVFGISSVVPINEYLYRGMSRGQLLQAYGHELPEAIEDEPEDTDS